MKHWSVQTFIHCCLKAEKCNMGLSPGNKTPPGGEQVNRRATGRLRLDRIIILVYWHWYQQCIVSYALKNNKTYCSWTSKPVCNTIHAFNCIFRPDPIKGHICPKLANACRSSNLLLRSWTITLSGGKPTIAELSRPPMREGVGLFQTWTQHCPLRPHRDNTADFEWTPAQRACHLDPHAIRATARANSRKTKPWITQRQIPVGSP